jgi:hypothetical protein
LEYHQKIWELSVYIKHSEGYTVKHRLPGAVMARP